jgi:Peptidase inhibitor family I36
MFKRMRRFVVVAIVAVGLLGGGGMAGAVEQGRSVGCERGEFCLWWLEGYRGAITRVSLDTANPGECVPLPGRFEGRSFANRSSRQVTVYQDRSCSTEGEFDTYPGLGTYVPEAPYVVRAVQIWE